MNISNMDFEKYSYGQCDFIKIYACSACNKEFTIADGQTEDDVNFCPVCGTRIDWIERG